MADCMTGELIHGAGLTDLEQFLHIFIRLRFPLFVFFLDIPLKNFLLVARIYFFEYKEWNT